MNVNTPGGQRRATALIADDEEPMRQQLRSRLQEAWPGLEIVAEATNGIEAVALAGHGGQSATSGRRRPPSAPRPARTAAARRCCA